MAGGLLRGMAAIGEFEAGPVWQIRFSVLVRLCELAKYSTREALLAHCARSVVLEVLQIAAGRRTQS